MPKRTPTSVLMTADTVGGVWTYALELARGLSSDGIRITLATMGAHLTRQQRIQTLSIPNLDVHESNFRLEWMENPWDDVRRAGEWLLALEQRVCPDVVHLNGYVHADLAWLAPCLVVGHSCVASWWWHLKQTEMPAQWNCYRERVSAGLRSADMVVAPSKDMLAALRLHYVWCGPARVIQNGLAPTLTPGRKENFLLCAGRLWDEAKNLALIASAAEHVRWKIYAAGEHRNADAPASFGDHVQLLGTLEPAILARWMAAAPIFLAPAKYEPFGLSILEAALCGCALILGDISSLHELWDGAALFIATDDVASLIGSIEQLIDNPQERERLGREARERALTFSQSRMTEAYLQVYSDLMEGAFSSSAEAAACR